MLQHAILQIATIIHSPNENYRLDHFYKGIETIIAFYQHFAKGGEIA